VADLVGTQRQPWGAAVTVVAAVVTLVGAVLLMRAAARAKPEAARYERRATPQREEPPSAMSERAIWDALDEGRDPTNPDNKGR
jgi:uncharacterized membrane protein (TIGR02234 family)